MKSNFGKYRFIMEPRLDVTKEKLVTKRIINIDFTIPIWKIIPAINKKKIAIGKTNKILNNIFPNITVEAFMGKDLIIQKFLPSKESEIAEVKTVEMIKATKTNNNSSNWMLTSSKLTIKPSILDLKTMIKTLLNARKIGPKPELNT